VRHFTEDNELKQILRDVLQSRGTEFYNTGIQCLTERRKKCDENDGDFVEKQPHNCKKVSVIHVNLAVTAIKFSEKRHYFRTATPTRLRATDTVRCEHRF
jgi:hypothetical protein